MSFGIWELLVVLGIVALLFGTKKLRTMGTDLGSAVKGFRAAISDDDNSTLDTTQANPEERVIEGEVDPEDKSASSGV